MEPDSVDIDAIEKKLRNQTRRKRKANAGCLVDLFVFILLALLFLYTLLAVVGTHVMTGWG